MTAFIAALALLESAPAPTYMHPPAMAGFLVPLLIPALAGTFGGAVLSAAVNIAAAFGFSYIATKLLSKPQAATTPTTKATGGSQLDLRVDADVPRSLILGRATTAGSSAYFATYGGNNQNLIEIVALADHPVERLFAVFLEGLPATLRDSGTDRGFLVDAYTGSLDAIAMADLDAHGGPLFGQPTTQELYDYLLSIDKLQKYGDKLALQFFDGRQTTADPFTVAALGTRETQPWTAQHIGVGIGYARLHSIYNMEKVPGRIRWRFVIDGLRLYDPRKDTTAGGSGTHRFDDLSTHEWTDNLAVMIYNICRGIYVADENGDRQFFYGLEGTTADQLPLDIWFAAMNECDVAVTLASGATEKQFTGGGEFTVDTEPLEVIQALLKGCGGRFVEIGGIYKLYVGAPGLPVFSFDDGSVLASREDRFKPILKLEDRINYLTGKYTSASDGYMPKVAPPQENIVWRQEDGRRLPSDLDAPVVQSDTQMQRLMLQLLNRSRRQRKHIIPLPPQAMVLEPGDVVSWTSARNGYDGKLFEVDGVDYEPNLITTLSLTEVDPADYDWSPDFERPVTSGVVVTLQPPPKVIGGFAASPFIYLGDNGQRLPAIRLTWDDPQDGDVVAVLWQVRRPSEADDIMSGSFDNAADGRLVITGGLQSLTDYEVRARFQSFNGFAADWSLWIPVTTPDARVTQAALDAALNAVLQRVNAQIPAYLDRLREDVNDVSAALAAQVASLREALGRVTIGVGARYGENKAAVDLVQTAVATAEQAIADLTESVNAHFDDTDARVQQALTAAAGVDSAVSALTQQTTARFADATAAINTAAQAVADANSAIAALTNTVTAQFGSNSAEIVSILASIAATNETLGKLSIDATVNYNSLSATGLLSVAASADPGGALAAIELMVKASSAGVSVSAGIQLAAFLDAALNAYSRLRLFADRLEIGAPSQSGGDFFPPFAVQVVNGARQIALKPDALPDASVDVRALVPGITGLFNVLRSTDVARTITDWHSSGAGNTVISGVFTVSDGSALRVTFTTVIDQSGNDTNSQSGWFRVLVNGALAKEIACQAPVASGASSFRFNDFPFTWSELIDSVSGGNCTVEVRFERDHDSGGTTITMVAPTLQVQEIRNPVINSITSSVPTPAVAFQGAIFTGASQQALAAAIGAADGFRVVVVGLGWQSTLNTKPTLTINGAAAAFLVQSDNKDRHFAWFALRVAAGTTADLVANIGAADAGNIVFIVNRVIAFSQTPVSVKQSANGSSSSANLQVGGHSGDVVLAAAYGDGGATGYSAAFTGAETVSERVDASAGTPAARYAAYDLVLGASGGTSQTLTISETGGTQPFAAARVSFR